ncbi:hypothetical protein TSAR_003637 [Trichomalopsis sarcophagae]|uniref:Ubiquitin-like domain-containing protein n=1 Tax=Trichomalopsis sarcophagae TaxID=543379 RepID=A0A232FJ59_9HYME|nr:hypothetical protein TSAR_003637 [Trichomalopsis sarcophagae]
MTLIEGVGDEVLDFFIVVGVLLVGYIAWCSTNIADQPLIRTVLILQHRTRSRIAALRANQQVLALAQQQRSTESSENESRQSNSGSSSEVEASCPESSLPATSQASNESTETPAATNEEVLIQAMDSFNNEETTLLQQETKVDKDEKTTTETETTTASAEPEQAEPDISDNNEHKICIKLKFINDDQKLVTGNLKESLGDFKRRHFQLELDSRKMVRLVFNGQVLQPDNHTLEQYGFFHNCVVHCLIHQPRPAPAASSTLDSSSRMYFNPPFQNMPAGAGLGSVQTEWDLSRLMVSVVTLILGLAWYFRYHYAQLFTVTTTVGLFGLTAIFTVSLFGHLFPDQDSIRNIE